MDEYTTAIEQLPRGDLRLEQLIKELAESHDPAAHRALVCGAGRFFDTIEELATSRAHGSVDWPTLEQMFESDDYLIHALLLAMDPSDDLDEQRAADAQALARRTLDHASHLSVLGVAWGRAMRVVAKYRMDDLVYLARGYVVMFRDEMDHRNTLALSAEMIINLAESAITIAELDAENAQPILRKIFTKYYRNADYRADVVGAVIGGLIVLEPTAPDVLAWTEQLLRPDQRPARVYGALAGVAAARLQSASVWVQQCLQDDGVGARAVLVGDVGERARRALDLVE